MLSPQELNNREFSKTLRGYSPAEVDEQLDFMIKKYTELYEEHEKLQKKFRLAEAQLDAMKAEEQSVRSALVNAQKAGSRIIAEANKQADTIMQSAKKNCEQMAAKLKGELRVENGKLRAIKQEVAAFKATLFEGYRAHISAIEQIAPDEGADPPQEEQLNEAADAILSCEANEQTSNCEDPVDEIDSASVLPPSEEPAADEASPKSEPIWEDESGMPETASALGAEYSPAVKEQNSGSIVDSIKAINRRIEQSSHGDDEELLHVLKTAAAADEDPVEDDFRTVYDGKRR